MGFLSSIFGVFSGGGGAIGSLSKIASEYIETKKETAEANALFIKTLDPNGIMRREISSTVNQLFKIYILTMMALALVQAFSVGNADGAKDAMNMLIDIFIPVTASFTTILTASFGINAYNVKKGL